MDGISPPGLASAGIVGEPLTGDGNKGMLKSCWPRGGNVTLVGV